MGCHYKPLGKAKRKVEFEKNVQFSEKPTQNTRKFHEIFNI